jgi:hypothetical protein
MDDERPGAVIRTLSGSHTRRGVLAAVAAVSALHLSEAAAKRREKRSGGKGRLTAESRAQAVTIETERGEVPAGDFTATGAIDDAGTFTFERVHFGAVPTPSLLIVPTLEVFAGEQGTFSLQNRVKITLTDQPGVLTMEGSWSVFSGTGAYERMHGHGTISGSITLTDDSEVVRETFTGTVHFD